MLCVLYLQPPLSEEHCPLGLTKDNLVASVYENTDLPRRRSRQLVETFLELIQSTLASGSDVMISRFGKFEIKDKTSGRERNPQTGESVMLDARQASDLQMLRGLDE
jgi:integration host factor subunit alpha